MLLSEFDQKLLQEWDYEKNNELNIFPDKITSGSAKKVYWKCENNHSWLAAIYSRTSTSKTGCPYCTGKQILKGFNDLLTVHPNLCIEWDYNKNNIRSDEITSSSNKKVYWKCNKGHSWEASIASRVHMNSGCPYCSNHKVLKGYNDLLTLNPDICKEWDYEKNDCNPDEVLSGSHEKVYWKCNNNHSYKMSIASRTQKNYKCPYCSNHKVLKGYNDLLSNFPDITKEWNYELNTIKPDEITSGSHKTVYWKCNKGHSWTTPIYFRTRHYINSSCPICKK